MSLNDILQIDRERVRREKVVLHTVYDRMKNRINLSARARSKACLYTIPEFIPGYPLINLPKTMDYLLKKLRKEGFMAVSIDHANIWIAWDPQAIRDLDRRQRGLDQSQTQTQQKQHVPLSNLVQGRQDDFIDALVRSKVKDRKY